MTRWGYTLFTEDHDPRDLLRDAVRAEEAGFDWICSSDHFHPWLDDHSDASFAWSLMGAVAAQTSRAHLTTLVTCPILRYHPAIVAQAAATIAVLSEGRFSLSLGAGERLNEHVVGKGWPSIDVRHEMLDEAIDIMQLLWSGGYHTYRGRHFTLEDAQVWTLPETPPEIFVATSGPQSAQKAAEKSHGMVAIEPDADLVQAYRDAGGEGTVRGQVTISYYPDRDQAIQTAWEKFRFALPGWKVMAELPNPVNFEAMASIARPEDMTGLVSCGPDVEEHVQTIRQFIDAGYDEVAIVQCGPDQASFFRFWEEELRPALES